MFKLILGVVGSKVGGTSLIGGKVIGGSGLVEGGVLEILAVGGVARG